MNDILPDNRNSAAKIVGLVFHPAVVGAPTLMAILSEMTLIESLSWIGLMLTVLLVPNIILQIFLQQKGRFVYQRQTRLPMYVVGWCSVLVCLIILALLNAPKVLVACLMALLVWIPFQLIINQKITKISIHVAVISGCLTGLLVLNKLDSPELRILAPVILVLTAWARIKTKNHTLLQVALGAILGCLPVLIVFPIVLR
ncbi:MAG: hypothetical protein LCI00_15765 [Chloroflexi bacterium]|nr:hypothetical protein [Chloroflexota bacterium]